MRGQRHAPAALYPWERPGTHCTEGCVGPRAGPDRCGKSRPPTGIRFPDRPAHSQSLYQLCYLAHHIYIRCWKWFPSACRHTSHTHTHMHTKCCSLNMKVLLMKFKILYPKCFVYDCLLLKDYCYILYPSTCPTSKNGMVSV